MLDTTVPFGSVAFTSDALIAKQKGVNTMVPAMDANSNYALAEALKQAGVKLKATLYATGYEQDVINSPAWSSLQGAYFFSPFRPWPLANAGTQQMQAAMEKYAHFTKSQFPNFGQYEAWAGADLMIKGLELAGPNPTRASVITHLRGAQVLQRQRTPPAVDQLLDDLRPRPGPDVRLGHAGGQERLHGDLVAADLRDGHPRHLDRQLFVDGRSASSRTIRRRRRRRIASWSRGRLSPARRGPRGHAQRSRHSGRVAWNVSWPPSMFSNWVPIVTKEDTWARASRRESSWAIHTARRVP